MHSQDSLDLLSEPYISYLKRDSLSEIIHPKIYVSYNAKTQETTVMTTELNQLHLSMIQHLMALSGPSSLPEETARLLIQCFAVVQERFATVAVEWDRMAREVCCSRLPFTPASCAYPPSQQDMPSRSLGNTANHEKRVWAGERITTLADEVKGDFRAFQSALISLERYFQGLGDTMNLDPKTIESLGELITEQKIHCEVTSHLVDNIVTRYDRFLNVVWWFYPHSNQCLIQKFYRC